MLIGSGKKAFSVIEYTMLIVMVVVALIIFRTYILNGFNGHWKMAGDSFGLGRQYDPQKTVDCVYDSDGNVWYDQGCFDALRQNCQIGNFTCEEMVMNGQCNTAACAQ